MTPLHHLSIRAKVALMGSLLIVAFLILGASFAFSLNTVLRSNLLLGRTQIALRESSELLNAVLEMRGRLRGYLMTGGRERLKSYYSAQEEVFRHLDSLRTSVSDPALKRPMDRTSIRQITDIDRAVRQWKREVADPLLRSRPPVSDTALYRYQSISEDRLKAIRQEVNRFQADQQNLNIMRRVKTDQAATLASKIAFLGSGLVLLLVLLGFLLLSRSIMDPLFRLIDLGQAISSGDYSRRIPHPGRTELGRLSSALNVMAENLETVRGEQVSIRTRLEALNRLASHVSRSLHTRDRAEAVAMTLQREFGARGVQVWLPESDRGWACIEVAEDGPVEYRLYNHLPDPLQAVVAAKREDQQVSEGTGEVVWTSPMFRADRASVLLRIRFSADQWKAAVPLLTSINRFCVNAFEISRVYDEVSTERQRLDAILNSTGEGVLVVDREGKVALANPAALHTLRLKHRPVMGLPLDDVLGEEKFAALRHFIQNPPKASRTSEGSGALPLGERFLTATRAPIQDRGLAGVVVVIRDVTQQVEVDRMKSEFISIVSHELRTPLTSIKGSLGLLLGGAGGDLPEKIRGLLGIAQSNTDRLIRLINDILDISKIEAGRVEMTREPLDLRETIRAAVKSLDGMAKPVKVRLKINVPKEKLMVMGDADRLSQVIVNLVSNAIKFSPIGSTVEVRAEQHHHVIEVNVIDEGAGIPMEHQTKLFTKFYQVDSSSSRAKSGTGLGLAISNALVKEHSGLMGVESLEGQGSRFWFTLPAWRSGSPEQPEERPYVLIGSDDPRLRRTAAELLERHDYLCVPAASDDFPLRLKQGEYDLVLADLPHDGRGERVLDILGEREETRRLPVGFLVPDGKGEAAPPRRVAGWLYRAMDEKQFQDTLRHMLKFGRRKSDELTVAPLVLVAHDDPGRLEGLASAVLATGMRVLQAHGADEALKTLGGESPDAVVLDVALPGLAEVEATVAALRPDRPVPVLFVSARDLLQGGLPGGGDGPPETRPPEEQRRMADELTRLFRDERPAGEAAQAAVRGGERK